MKPLRKPSYPHTTKALTWLLFFCLMLLPVRSLAASVYLRDYGTSLRLPASMDVFTRDMPANDPVLALYGMSREEVNSDLMGQGLDLLAYDIAGDYEITLAFSYKEGDDFSTLDDGSLQALAQAHGGSAYQLYSGSQASFLETVSSRQQAFYLAQAGGLRLVLTLTAYEKITDSMLRTARSVMQSADFGLGQ